MRFSSFPSTLLSLEEKLAAKINQLKNFLFVLSLGNNFVSLSLAVYPEFQFRNFSNCES